MFKGLVETNEVVKEEKNDANNQKEEETTVKSGAELLIKQLMVAVAATGSLIAMINPLNSEFYTKIQAKSYNIVEYLTEIQANKELEKTIASTVKTEKGGGILARFIRALGKNNSQEVLNKTIDDVQEYKEAVSTLKKVLGDSAERVTVELSTPSIDADIGFSTPLYSTFILSAEITASFGRGIVVND